MLAAWLHLLLDAVQDLPGRCVPLLFPSARAVRLPTIIDPNGRPALIVGSLAVAPLIWGMMKPPSVSRFEPRAIALLPLAAGAILAAGWWKRLIRLPCSELGFLAPDHPEEGRKVGLADAEVIEGDPPSLRRLDRQFPAHWPEDRGLPLPGSRITVHGRFHGGSVDIERWRQQPERWKLALTLIGLAAFFGMWLRP